jgi:hypothetical protein
MNLPLLWWAYKQIGDPRYFGIAQEHARRSAQLHVRSDGSIRNRVDFDLQTGAVLHLGDTQSYPNDFTWQRDHACGLHGFALAYQATENPVLWRAAERLSEYFCARLAGDDRCDGDFCDPPIPNIARDTSAAVIAAIGWLNMGGKWWALGEQLLKRLASDSLTGGCHGILACASINKRQRHGTQEATVWGDYFLLDGVASLIENGEGVYDVLKRKLITFRRDPVGSSAKKLEVLSSKIEVWSARSPRVKKHINQLCRSWGKHQLSKRGYLNLFRHRPPTAIPPDFADLWFLYKAVRTRKPRCILEFGSGCSTVILAQALWDNQRTSPDIGGYLYSVDGDQDWADVTTKLMPSHLVGLCEISYSPVLEIEHDGTPSFRHANVPNVIPDLLYLDGPALTPERQVAVDVLDIEERFPPGFCLIIDGRWQNTMFLKEYLKRHYRFKPRYLFTNYMFELITSKSQL